jgi:hypothetical protein
VLLVVNSVRREEVMLKERRGSQESWRVESGAGLPKAVGCFDGVSGQPASSCLEVPWWVPSTVSTGHGHKVRSTEHSTVSTLP